MGFGDEGSGFRDARYARLQCHTQTLTHKPQIRLEGANLGR